MQRIIVGDNQYTCMANDINDARNIMRVELSRIDKIKAMLSNLLTANGKSYNNFQNNTSETRVNTHFYDEYSLIYDKSEYNCNVKGEVRERGRNQQTGDINYDLAYRYRTIGGNSANFRLAHEMGHLMLNPDNTDKFTYNRETDSYQVSGLIRNSGNTYYGIQMQENAINLLAQLGIRKEHGISADDIITGNQDVSEFNSYRKNDSLIKMLAMSMRNDYDIEYSFEQMTEAKLDGMLEYPNGKTEPINTFFYGLVNDSSIIENEFDKYTEKGAWKDLSSAIDKLYTMNPNSKQFQTVYGICQDMILDFSRARIEDKHHESQVRNPGYRVPSTEGKISAIMELAERKNSMIITGEA